MSKWVIKSVNSERYFSLQTVGYKTKSIDCAAKFTSEEEAQAAITAYLVKGGKPFQLKD